MGRSWRPCRVFQTKMKMKIRIYSGETTLKRISKNIRKKTREMTREKDPEKNRVRNPGKIWEKSREATREKTAKKTGLTRRSGSGNGNCLTWTCRHTHTLQA